ncbi:DUF4352 domain-containing protein [Niallia sp. HCP3S3_B10]|jgi:hypothetical protein|uniref:DUF4352 domain-containing protein n=1 Tax=unclassified Niallia TaxID=2837522 RepID=UPI00203C6B42|nr:DUF4352 domain-containing protein [Niallia sp. MER TA 168]MCM3364028.1 DUF4352 domain-containing protein [Niallia sp. MER TA 168]
MKKKTMVVFSILLAVLLTACGDSTSSSGDGNKGDNEKTKGLLKTEDIDKMYTDPDKYKGYEVELTGQIFTDPEKDDEGTYFQMWGDPENVEKNTLVAVNDPNLEVRTDQYVKIKGIVKDKFEGENGFGAEIVAPMITAESVEVIDYITAIAPTIKEIKVDQEINQHDLIVTLQKIEIAENQTRVYIKVQNNTQDNASFYSHSTKLIVGSKQLEEEYMDPTTTGLAEIQSELLPDIETEGVIVYPAIDPNETSLKLHAETYSDNYDLDFQPYVFEVTIN